MNPFQPETCLICHSSILPAIGWRAIFLAEKENNICSACRGKLEPIEGEVCQMCNRPFHLLKGKFRDGELCHDCYRWENDDEWKGYLKKNTSLFLYNGFLKEVIAQYKFRGDYVLARVFTVYLKEKLLKTENDLFVPIPLSEERLYERGFNQAEAILFEAGFQPTEILSRVHSEKQSKKSRNDRIHLPQVFQIGSDIDIAGQRIILVDDIYTTGSTLRHAAKLLIGAGAGSVESLTIAR
jgi:competence protein ComFC